MGFNSEEFQVPMRQIQLNGDGDERTGADLLIGVQDQKKYVEGVSVRRSEVKIRMQYADGKRFRQVLKTLPISEMRERMNSDGLRVVHTTS